MYDYNTFNEIIVKEDYSDGEIQYIHGIYNTIGKEKILSDVSKKKIAPFAARTFIALNIDVDYWNCIKSEYTNRNNAIVDFLKNAYELLRRSGVTKMFVSENFGALLSSDADISLFSSGDVDNYAAIEEKPLIYHVLSDMGCEIKERYLGKKLVASCFFVPKSYNLPEHFHLNVDFYPLIRDKLPCVVNMDCLNVWNGIRKFKNTSIILPSKEILTYICLLHITVHSYCRAPDIRLYVDLLNMYATNPDYCYIANLCVNDGVINRVATAARISNSIMKTKFPKVLTESNKRIDRLTSFVFDINTGNLKYNPNKLKVLLIEIMADDISNFHGINKILFPSHEWIKEMYGKASPSCYLKHIIHLI